METLDFAPGMVFTERGRLYTESLCPGKRVYGERLVSSKGKEYREWDPRRSKLSAYLALGGKQFPFRKDSTVLYLGASSGTTPSHVGDICSEGKVLCVEISQRMFRELVSTCSARRNLLPVLGDATDPGGYSAFADSVDIVYQDVAQKRQAEIICGNMDAFNAKYGMLAIKARSEDVTASPESIFRESEKIIAERGFEILDARSLEPYEKSHEMIVFRREEPRERRTRSLSGETVS